MGKTEKPKASKNAGLKITCHYNNEPGKEPAEILRESFRIFVRNELLRLCKKD